MEDTEGILAKLTAVTNPEEFMMNDSKVNLTHLSMGYTATLSELWARSMSLSMPPRELSQLSSPEALSKS